MSNSVENIPEETKEFTIKLTRKERNALVSLIDSKSTELIGMINIPSAGICYNEWKGAINKQIIFLDRIANDFDWPRENESEC